MIPLNGEDTVDYLVGLTKDLAEQVARGSTKCYMCNCTLRELSRLKTLRMADIIEAQERLGLQVGETVFTRPMHLDKKLLDIFITDVQAWQNEYGGSIKDAFGTIRRWHPLFKCMHSDDIHYAWSKLDTTLDNPGPKITKVTYTVVMQ